MKPKLIPYNDEAYFDYNDNMSIVCKLHKMKIEDQPFLVDPSYIDCLEGHRIYFGKGIDTIRKLLSARINSKVYQEAEYFDIDGYLVPASKEVQVKTKSSEYSVTTQVKKSEKKGEQILIYIGKKGIEGKSQIFIDPNNPKMTFDQNDINPSDFFVKFEATFRDGSKVAFEKPSDE